MGKLWSIVGVMVLFLFGCKNNGAGNIMEIPKDVKLPEQVQVCLVEHYLNFAWGHQEMGIFLDTTGKVYAFDFSLSEWGSGEDSLLEKFSIIREFSEPVGKIDEETVKKIYFLGNLVDEKSKFMYTDETMCDAGQESVYVVNPSTGKIIECETEGDRSGWLEDEAAKELLKIYRKAMGEKNLYKYDGTHVYMQGDISIASYSVQNDMGGRYFVADAAQLKSLAKETWIPLDGILKGMDEYALEENVYFVEFGAPPAKALVKKGDSYQLAYDKGELCCNVVSFPFFGGNFTQEKVICGAGGFWERIKEGDMNYDKELIRGEAYDLSGTGLQSVWNSNDMDQYQGLYIADQEKYKEFLSQCDSAKLTSGGSIKEILEQNITPDFEKYGLAIMLVCYNENKKFKWERTEVRSRVIQVGCVMEMDEYSDDDKCALGFAWIPKKYLTDSEEERYYVR